MHDQFSDDDNDILEISEDDLLQGEGLYGNEAMYLRERAFDWALVYAKLNKGSNYNPADLIDIAKQFEGYLKGN